MLEYKVSLKVEGKFHKTSTVTRNGQCPTGTEKIKPDEPFFLIQGETDEDNIKMLCQNIAAAYLHQKYGRSEEMGNTFLKIKEKFNLK
jgi:hypothetical protein